MEATEDITFKNDNIIVSRCGYTGEDGFEVSLPNTQVEAFMDRLWTVKGENNEQLATHLLTLYSFDINFFYVYLKRNPNPLTIRGIFLKL